MLRYSICYAPDSPPPVPYAAEELDRYLRLAGALPGGGRTFRLLLRPDAPEGGGFRRTVSENAVTLEAAEPCGILYAVYDFLESLGFRFLAPDCEVIPSGPEFPENGTTVSVPAFRARELFWREAMDGAFAVRLRLNSARSGITPAQGGKLPFYNFSHTFDQLVPVDRWFPSHPEYFSMIGGKRIRERTQLCLSNPDVLALCVAGVQEWIREHPDKKIFSVSMNDWYNACECPACRAADEEEGSRAGSVIRFVNAVADAVAEDHPDVYIHTFAYLYCRKPPRHVRPARNVIVRLCSIECCFGHPIAECARERGGIDVQYGSAANFEDNGGYEGSFTEDLKGWAAITPNLFVWDYTVNYANYLLPFPNLNVLGANLELFRSAGVSGVFEQGNFSQGRSSALGQLKIYLLAGLLWDPSLDAEQRIRDFINGYYGVAAGPMAAYVRLWREMPGKHHIGIYDMPDSPWLTDSLLDRASALLDEALRLAAGKPEEERVLREALSVRYAVLSREDPAAPGHAGAVDAFMRDAEALGITELFERKDMRASGELMKTNRYTRGREGVPSVTYPI